MSGPFRDEGAALAGRVAQLEMENRELRARLDEERAAHGYNREAFVKRLSEENTELRETVRELRDEIAVLRAESRRNHSASNELDLIDRIRALFDGR